MIRTNLSTRPFYNERDRLALAARVSAGRRRRQRIQRDSRASVLAQRHGTRPSGVARRSARRGASQAGRPCADDGGSEADRVRVARGASGERSDRPPDVFLDRALQPLRDDVARRGSHHVGPAEDRKRAVPAHDRDRRAERRGHQPAHGSSQGNRRVHKGGQEHRGTRQRTGTDPGDARCRVRA